MPLGEGSHGKIEVFYDRLGEGYEGVCTFYCSPNMNEDKLCSTQYDELLEPKHSFIFSQSFN